MDQNADNLFPHEKITELFQQYHSASEAGLHTDAEEMMKQFLGNLDEWYRKQRKNPTPYDQLGDEADRRIEGFDYAGAEEILLKRLALPDLKAHQISSTHGFLSCLYRLLNQETKALEHARSTTATIREYSISTMPLVMRLHNEVRCLLQFGQVSAAACLVDEAHRLLEDSLLWNILLATNLIFRAECAVGMNKLDSVETDLETAYQLLAPKSAMELAAGIRHSLARYWKVIAMLHTARNDLASAVDARQQALTLEQEIAQMPHCSDVFAIAEVAEAFHDLAETLSQAGRKREAQEAFAERNEILAFLHLPAGNSRS